MAPSDCDPHQVLGVLKEMATIIIASVVLGDQVRLRVSPDDRGLPPADNADGPFHQVTRANLAGFGIVVCGLLLYHVIQWRDEQHWRRDERYDEGYEGGADSIASVAAKEDAAEAKGRYEGAVSAAEAKGRYEGAVAAAEAKGRYEGAVSARLSSHGLYATDVDVSGGGGGGGGGGGAAAGTLCRRSAATAEASACNGPSADRYACNGPSADRYGTIVSSTPRTTPPRMQLLHSRSLLSVPFRSIGLSSEPGSPAPWAAFKVRRHSGAEPPSAVPSARSSSSPPPSPGRLEHGLDVSTGSGSRGGTSAPSPTKRSRRSDSYVPRL